MPEGSSSRFILRLFGSFECRVDGRLVTNFRSKRSQSLLAVLALRPNSAVSRKWLADLLWPDSAEERGQFYLRRELSALRQALGSQSWRIESPTRDTLRLNCGDGDVDVSEFDRLSKSKDPDMLELALQLYRGPILAGVDEEWVFGERTDREQSLVQIMSHLTDALIRAGHYTQALPVFRKAIALEPLRESLHRSLFLTLAALGDYAAIAVAYRKLKAVLRREISAEPSPETQQCLKEIREQARNSRPHRETISLLPVSRPGTLPRLAIELLGREDDVRIVTDLVEKNAVVALTGPGGIGKTSLAIRIGEIAGPSFQGGVTFVTLAEVLEEAGVGQAICHALGTPTHPDQDIFRSLCETIGSQHLLLIVDNCEQVQAACSAVFEQFYQHCPNLRIVATSRHTFSLPGVRNVPVAPLEQPSRQEAKRLMIDDLAMLFGYPAYQCFLNRAERAGCPIEWSPKTAPLVASICERLEGLPLAIELAAARASSLSLVQIETKLARRLSLLTHGGDETNPRQKTLAAAIEWSFQLLSEGEKKLFSRLAVFAGGWTLEAAESICSSEDLNSDEVANLIGALVDKSLLIFDPTPPDGRYRFLETIREFALGIFNTLENAEEFKRRHLEYYFSLAEDCAPFWFERESIDFLRSLETEIGNLRACQEYCRDRPTNEIVTRNLTSEEADLSLVHWLLRLYFVRGYFAEGLAFARTAISRPDSAASPSLLAWGYLAAAIYTNFLGNPIEARDLLVQSRDLGHAGGDLAVVARAVQNIGWVHYRLGQLDDARSCYLDALEMHRVSGLHTFQALTLNYLAEIELSEGNVELAEAYAKKAWEISRERGCLLIKGYVQMTTGIIALTSGGTAEAETFLYDAIETLDSFGTRFHLGMAHMWMGRLGAVKGDWKAAGQHLSLAIGGFRQIGSELEIVRCLESLAWMAEKQGDEPLAAKLIELTTAARQHLQAPVTLLERRFFGDFVVTPSLAEVNGIGGQVDLTAAVEFAFESLGIR